MRHILILGAGKSAHVLIDELIIRSAELDLYITVADINIHAQQHLAGIGANFRLVKLSDTANQKEREELITAADLVISMLPAVMHIEIAHLCLKHRKHLITPSYISDEMQALHKDATDAGLLFLNEMGLDPGIDHMSAMQMIDQVKSRGGVITSFKSYCGGLVAPESDDNPWHYKFSWNPKNVVLAGQGSGGIRYLEDKELKYIPYHQLFRRAEIIGIPSLGNFEGYANRDSLKYILPYGLEDVETMLRGTLRKHPFCKAWDVFVQLGMTDDHLKIISNGSLSQAAFLRAFIPRQSELNLKKSLASYLQLKQDSEILEMIEWLGFFSEDILFKAGEFTAASLLQAVLESKWKLKENDKDMIVMHHDLQYRIKGEARSIKASLVVEGKNQRHTAMAATVGLPMALAVPYILNNNWNLFGVHMPVNKKVYESILPALQQHGIVFTEEDA